MFVYDDKMNLSQDEVTARNEGGEQWVTDGSQRSLNGLQPFAQDGAADVDDCRFNSMPPGMDIENQCKVRISDMPMSCAGESDASQDTSAASMMDGYKKKRINGLQDSNQSWAVEGGFAGRNEYMKR